MDRRLLQEYYRSTFGNNEQLETELERLAQNTVFADKYSYFALCEIFELKPIATIFQEILEEMDPSPNFDFNFQMIDYPESNVQYRNDHYFVESPMEIRMVMETACLMRLCRFYTCWHLSQQQQTHLGQQ